ncbi:muscarinic acetylcholine receptor M2 isoform X2 [Arapaima gigas]
MIAAAWILSFVLWAPAILFWQFLVGGRTVPEKECHIQFFSNAAVTFGTAIAAFYLPVIIMIVLYWQISKVTSSSTLEIASEVQQQNPAAQTDVRITKEPLKKKKLMPSRERKVTRTIMAILVAFVVTWTPYNVMVLINTFCTNCIPKKVWTIGYWLCYINSTVNPACYALCNVTFKNTFKHLILCQYKNIRSAR